MKVDLLLPTSLSEIPLSRYQDFIAMKEKSNDEEFIAQKMIQIFCGIKLNEVAQIRLKDLNELIDHFSKIFSEKPKLKTKFKIKNIEFGFIPKLDDITLGEYVDLENHLKSWETYHKAMAVMYRPITNAIGQKYLIEDYEPNEEMQNLMRNAPLDVAISASVFFWSLAKELYSSLVNYLERETRKMMDLTNTQNDINSPNIGDGIAASMRSLKEILPSLTRLQQQDLLNVSPISRSKSKKTKLKQENLNKI
jgi:hypothetical protein